ncbi:amidohydrolase family protein [Erysipelothrix sp. D19-032]
MHICTSNPQCLRRETSRRQRLPHGTTTIITDPHEAANVTGVRGVQYMHDSAEGLPMRHFVDIPSCVPSVLGLENSGAEFGVPEIETLASLDRVIGLAEVMDYLGVINGEARMMDIIAASEQRGLFIQGHAPSVSGRDLSAYICGGPRSRHESRSGAEGLEKLRSGLFVDARESSITKNVKDIWEAVKGSRYLDTLCLCTDDKEVEDVLVHGHMNEVVNAAISYGMDPIDAIRCASFNTKTRSPN